MTLIDGNEASLGHLPLGGKMRCGKPLMANP